MSSGELLHANANRSPTAYLANPPAERARYAHDTDKTMSLLQLLDAQGRCSRSLLPQHGHALHAHQSSCRMRSGCLLINPSHGSCLQTELVLGSFQ